MKTIPILSNVSLTHNADSILNVLYNSPDNECRLFLMKVAESVYAAMATGGVSVTRVAKDMNLTEQSFRRRLRKYAGLTPMTFFSAIQMKKAASLLTASTVLPIAKVAKACGFENSSSFDHKFKSFYGYAPSQFRDKANYGISKQK